jgi:hypothetical protein
MAQGNASAGSRSAFQVASRLGSWYSAYIRAAFNTQTTSLDEKNLAILCLAFLLGIPTLLGVFAVWEAWDNHSFHRLSPSEHLARAKAACGIFYSQCSDRDEAFRQLAAISSSAREYGEASEMRAALVHQRVVEVEAEQQRAREADEQARDQMHRNIQGLAHDSFECSTSTENQPIMSFDAGNHWWTDDGRCVKLLQQKRDEDARIHSYFSTTVRVDTDMNASWLPNEERTCKTLPDEKGEIATVVCSESSHETHNIPVEFWGSVDRKTVSNWKCRREKDVLSDEFVCRAID